MAFVVCTLHERGIPVEQGNPFFTPSTIQTRGGGSGNPVSVADMQNRVDLVSHLPVETPVSLHRTVLYNPNSIIFSKVPNARTLVLYSTPALWQHFAGSQNLLWLFQTIPRTEGYSLHTDLAGCFGPTDAVPGSFGAGESYVLRYGKLSRFKKCSIIVILNLSLPRRRV